MAGRKFTTASAKGRKFVTPTKVDPQKRAALSLYATPTLSMVNPLSTGVARPLTKAEIAKQQAEAKAALAKRALPTLSLATPKLAGALTATQNKPKGGIVREFVIPTRGFTDEETKKAKPTLKETAIGGAKFGAEILGGVMSISNLIGEKTGLNKLTGGNSEMADKISAWAEPETAGEAKSMRGLDIATLGFGGLLKSATKSARILSKVDDAAKVIKELKTLGLTPNPTLVTRIVAETDPKKILNILTETQKAESALLGASRAGTAQTPSTFRYFKGDKPRRSIQVGDVVDAADGGFHSEGIVTKIDGDNIHVSLTKDPSQIGKADAPVFSRRKVELIGETTSAGTAATRSTTQNTIRTADGVRVPVTGNKARFAERAKTVAPTAPIKTVTNAVRDTDELAIKAKNLIRDDIDTANRLIDTDNIDEKTVAIASEMLKKLADDAVSALTQTARDAANLRFAQITERLSANLTKAGRTVQAASILTRNTPEGMLKFIISDINRYNAGITKATKKIPMLTDAEKVRIVERWREIQKMPEGESKAIEVFKFKDDLAKRVPATNTKKFATLWRTGLLTGLKTTGLNISSNIGHAVSEIVKDAPATLYDKLASIVTGERTKAFTTHGIMRGLKEGTIKGKRYFSTGFDERSIGEKLDYNKVNFNHEVFNKYTETVFRIMGSTDQPFYYAAYARSMFDQALAQGMNQGLKGKELVKYAEDLVKAPTDDMVKYGVMDATTVVFQQDSWLAGKAAKLQRSFDGMEFVVPFARTPANVAMQILNYSPVGFIKPIQRVLTALYKTAKGAKGAQKLSLDDVSNIKNIEDKLFDQRLFSQEMGRATVGVALMTLGYKLAEKGWVSLGYPRGDERTQELNKAEGKRQNSIYVAGKWRTPMVLGPAGIVMLMGAHFQNAIKTSGSPTEAYAKALLGTSKSFLEQTFLTSINSWVQAMNDPERYGSSLVSNFTASFVPTLVSDVGRAIDPYERRASTESFADEVQQKLMTRIPWLREQLPKEVDVLGRTVKSIGNPIEILMDPSRPSPATPTPVSNEIRRLQQLSETVKDEEMRDALRRAMPLRPGEKNGYESFDQKQNRALWKIYGEALNKKLSVLFTTPFYQELDDETKAKSIEVIAQATSKEARALMVADSIRGLSGQELANKLIEHRDSGVLTEDVWALMSGN